MEKAARQALPQALQALPVDAAQAISITNTIGNPMSFVASYQVVRETLLPTYSLTTNLTFNQAMLRTNFGGKVASPTTPSPTAVAPTPRNTFVVRLSEPQPATQNQVFQQLNNLTDTEARYRLITIQGAEYTVETPLTETALTSQLGPLNAQVMPQFLPPQLVTPSVIQ
ncbi:MAG: hypothetical protein EBQ80_00910 [Proteobacteria bacterium]|nr:hypothetical protein [Pseudomonadota bacterium]